MKENLAQNIVDHDVDLTLSSGPGTATLLPEVREVFETVSIPSPASSRLLLESMPEFEIILNGSLCEYPSSEIDGQRVTTSERIAGETIMELDRLAVSIKVLHWLLDGSQESYEQFTECQKPETQLSKERFDRISKYVQETLDTEAKQQALLVALTLNTAAKVGPEAWDKIGPALGNLDAEQRERALDAVWQAWRQDTDDHQVALLHLLKTAPEISPSFSALGEGERRLIIDALESGLNIGQFLQLENMEASFTGYLGLESEARDFLNVFFLCLIAGAAGQHAQNGSLVVSEAYAARFETMRKALQSETEAEMYRPVLALCAEQLGADLESKDGRVLTRLGTMMGLSREEFTQLEEVFNSPLLGSTTREILRQELNETGLAGQEAVLVYYAPALLENCFKSSGRSIEGMLNGLQTAAAIYADTRSEHSDNHKNGVVRVYVRDYARLANEPELFATSRPVVERLVKNCRVIPRSNRSLDSETDAELLEKRRTPATELFLDHQQLQQFFHDLVDLRSSIVCREARSQLRNDIAQATFETSAKLFHLVGQISQYVPRRDLEGIYQANSWSGSQAELADSLERLQQTVSSLLDAVEGENEEIQSLRKSIAYASRRLENLAAQSKLSIPLYDIELSREDTLWVVRIPFENGNAAEFKVRRPEDALLDTDLARTFILYGKVAEVADHTVPEATPQEITRMASFLGTLFADIDVAVDSEKSAHILCLSPKPVWLGIADNKEIPQVHFELQAALQDLDITIGRLSDQLTLASPHKSHEPGNTSHILRQLRRKLQHSCINEIVSAFQGTSSGELQKRFTTLNAFVSEHLDPEAPAYTQLHTPQTDEEIAEVSNILSKISSQPERRPRDPWITEHGGITTLRQRIIEEKLRSKGWAVTFEDHTGIARGSYIVVPPEGMNESDPQLRKRFSLYGSQAHMALVEIESDAIQTMGLPIYEMLTNRVRLLTANADVGVGRVLTNNLLGIRSHLSVGRGNIFVGYQHSVASNVPYPGFNVLTEVANAGMMGSYQFGDFVHCELPELSKSERVGVVGALSSFWWDVFTEESVFPESARSKARMILNRSLPGLFDRDLGDLLELWQSVQDRKLALESTLVGGFARINVPQARALRELKKKMPAWESRVLDYLGSIHPTRSPDEVSILMRKCKQEDLRVLKAELEQHASDEHVRDLLSYY